MPNFIALGINFLFGTKFSWKEETDTCLNVECVLLGRSFDFLRSNVVVTARYLMVNAGYCSLLVVTARYRSLLLVPTFSMNAFTTQCIICNMSIARYMYSLSECPRS